MGGSLCLPCLEPVKHSRGANYLYSVSCSQSDADGICDSLDNCPNLDNLTQLDTDLDGFGDACDCAVSDNHLWSPPSGVQGLTLVHDVVPGKGNKPDVGTTTLNWNVPADPGGTATPLFYDTIRSENAADFGASATCIESDDNLDMTSTDEVTPAPGQVFFFVVRAENVCPLGLGSIGAASDGTLRTARSCP